MNVRGFRRLPPFPFPDAAWMANLPCDPCISQRGTHPMYFPEFHMFPGPQQLGVTGDNSFHTLFARAWAFLMCDDDRWFLLQWIGSDHLLAEGLQSPGWKVVEEPLLALPGLECGVQRRFTAAFDQSARLIVAYETDGVIEVTRWESAAQEYKQNVSFDGHDPALLIDAAVTDPIGYPNLLDDEWGVREAHYAGLRVLFEWLPEPAWRDTAIPDSDVLLFHLTPDRLGVRARVQRELYQTEHVIHDVEQDEEAEGYDASVQSLVLDQAIALPGRYQLLASNQAGAPLGHAVPDGLVVDGALVSDSYLGGFIINPRVTDAFVGGVTPDDAQAAAQMHKELVVDVLDSGLTPEHIANEVMIRVVSRQDALDAGLAPETAVAAVMVYVEQPTDTLDSGLVPDDPILAEAQIALTLAEDELDAGIAPEAIRVQAV